MGRQYYPVKVKFSPATLDQKGNPIFLKIQEFDSCSFPIKLRCMLSVPKASAPLHIIFSKDFRPNLGLLRHNEAIPG